MKETNQHSSDNVQKPMDDDSIVRAPFKAPSYDAAFQELNEALNTENSVILQGVESSGKSTLVKALIQENQNNHIPTVYISNALKKPSELYLYLSEILHTDKTKKTIIEGLKNFKRNNQHCLLVIDQDGINTAPQVTGILQQLCSSNGFISGSIKLIIVRRDYLVIPKEILPNSDFHNWIPNEVTLKLLQESDIDSYINYLATVNSTPAPPYALGVDVLLIQQSEGRIGKLKNLLIPIIKNDVITLDDLNVEQDNATSDTQTKFTVQPQVIVASGVALLLTVTLVTYLVISFQEKPDTITENTQPIFAETGTPIPAIKAPYQTSKKPVFVKKAVTIAPESQSKETIIPKTHIISPSAKSPVLILKPQPQKIIIEKITQTIDHWLLAWQTRNFTAYTKHYQATFSSSSVETHSEWKLQRQRALTRPKWLKLQRSELKDLLIEEGEVSVRFWLKYESSTGYRDRTLKLLKLTAHNNQWLISEEINELVRRGF